MIAGYRSCGCVEGVGTGALTGSITGLIFALNAGGGDPLTLLGYTFTTVFWIVIIGQMINLTVLHPKAPSSAWPISAGGHFADFARSHLSTQCAPEHAQLTCVSVL
jgi:hypothetical protein